MKKMYGTENLYSAFHQFIKVGGERIWASRSYFAFRSLMFWHNPYLIFLQVFTIIFIVF